MDRPSRIVTLTTDFGTADSYVAEMKAAVLRHCRDAMLVDVTHQIARHDIVAGALALERAVTAFEGQGAVHLAVVDPGVGSDRRILIVRIMDQTIVCPDNGLATWAWRRRGPGTAFEMTWRPAEYSSVFHGRDLMGPIAGRLAASESIDNVARPISHPVLLPFRPAATLADAEIIHVDHFGNATTNVPADLVRGMKLPRTYSDVAIGKPVTLIGSSGLVEIAVREGSAAEQLRLKVGDKVHLP